MLCSFRYSLSDISPCNSGPCPKYTICSPVIHGYDNHSFTCTEHCKRSTNGEDYQGSLNITKEGNACIPWTLAYDISDTVRYIFTGRRSNLAENNYCRQPRGYTRHPMAKEGPWCLVKDASGNYTKQFCDVPYCADASKYFV